MARTKTRRRRTGLLLLGGVALTAGLLVARRRRAAASTSTPPAPPASALREEEQSPAPRPGVSNYDAAGPVANTATAVPTPEALELETVDEREEEAAAAAEAANIGGQVSDYAGPALDEPASEADRPLEEAGEGVAEGQEQTEAELAAAAEPTAPGRSPEQAQIEDVIEDTERPDVGERPEPGEPLAEPESDAADAIDRPAPFDATRREEESGDADREDTPGGPSNSVGSSWPATGERQDPAGAAAPEWRTWSGRALDT